VANSDHRLQKKPINGRVGIVQSGEVNLAVPPGEELVVSGQPLNQVVGQEEAGPGSPASQTGSKISRRHVLKTIRSSGHRANWAIGRAEEEPAPATNQLDSAFMRRLYRLSVRSANAVYVAITAALMWP